MSGTVQSTVGKSADKTGAVLRFTEFHSKGETEVVLELEIPVIL